MKRPLLLVTLSLLTLFQSLCPVFAQEETVLEAIARTGILKVALREDAPPFGYQNANGVRVGFCLDFFEELEDALKETLKREVLLIKIFESTLVNRFDVVENKLVHLECGPNTIRDIKDKQISFSRPFWVSGTQFLISNNSSVSVDVNGSMDGVKIGVLRHTTTEALLNNRFPDAEIKKFQGVTGRRRGVQAMKQDRIQAFAGDGILLLGEAVLQNLQGFQLVPTLPLDCEYYGLILPEDDDNWQTLVNSVIHSKDSAYLYREWFGTRLSKVLASTEDHCTALEQ